MIEGRDIDWEEEDRYRPPRRPPRRKSSAVDWEEEDDWDDTGPEPRSSVDWEDEDDYGNDYDDEFEDDYDDEFEDDYDDDEDDYDDFMDEPPVFRRRGRRRDCERLVFVPSRRQEKEKGTAHGFWHHFS